MGCLRLSSPSLASEFILRMPSFLAPAIGLLFVFVMPFSRPNFLTDGAKAVGYWTTVSESAPSLVVLSSAGAPLLTGVHPRLTIPPMHVNLRCDKLKVFRVRASTVSARMVELEAFRNLPVLNCPRHVVYVERLASPVYVDAELTVATHQVAFPAPSSVLNNEPRKKEFNLRHYDVKHSILIASSLGRVK